MNRIPKAYKVRAIVYALVISMASSAFFWLPSFALAVTITNITVTEITATSAKINWTTDVEVIGLVDYGTTAEMGQPMVGAEFGKTHSISLAGLAPNTKYYFRIYVDDGEDQNALADGTPFTTLASTSNPPPPPNPNPPPPGPNPPPPAPNPPPPAPNPPPPPVTGPIYATGLLAKESSNATIYFLMGKDKVKIPFANAEAFLGLGYKFSQVQTLNLSAYRLPNSYFINSANIAHPWGSLTIWKDGTVYYMHPDGAIGIPTMEVIQKNGLSSVPIVPMNKYDEMEWGRNPKLPPLQVGDPRLL